MRRPFLTTSLAPMCWVMPPRSPAATSVVRIASSRLVLPWSTWPMTVTMGARGCSFDGIVLLEEDLLGGLGGGRLAVGLGRLGRGRLGDLVAQLAGHEAGRVAVDELVDGGEDAALDQLADDVREVDAEQLGELLDGDRGRDLDRAALGRIDGLDGRPAVLLGASRWLARPAPVARTASATSHGDLLRSDSGKRGRSRAAHAARPAAGSPGRAAGRRA